MTEDKSNFDRVETAANIFVRMSLTDGDGATETFAVPVSELDLNKDVDVERVRETGLYPDGYAINAIDVDGSITFMGNIVRTPAGGEYNLDELLYHDDGTPKVFNVTVVHENPANENDEKEDTDTIEDCIVTSSNYNASSGETTESSYDFMARRLS